MNLVKQCIGRCLAVAMAPIVLIPTSCTLNTFKKHLKINENAISKNQCSNSRLRIRGSIKNEKFRVRGSIKSSRTIDYQLTNTDYSTSTAASKDYHTQSITTKDKPQKSFIELNSAHTKLNGVESTTILKEIPLDYQQSSSFIPFFIHPVSSRNTYYSIRFQLPIVSIETSLVEETAAAPSCYSTSPLSGRKTSYQFNTSCSRSSFYENYLLQLTFAPPPLQNL